MGEESGDVPGQPEVREVTSLRAAHRLGTLKLLQWNCDGLATKRDELEELLRRR